MSLLKKQKKISNIGIINIKSTSNNTLITLTDLLGNVLAWASSGTVGFKGTRKKTIYAAQSVAYSIAQKTLDFGIKSLNINLMGQGISKESIIKTLNLMGLSILSITDKTAIAFNGCRPAKKRRI